MCGITGFVDFGKKTTASVLKEMTDAMYHRGPDDAGHEVYNAAQYDLGFGQRRLSILDLCRWATNPCILKITR